MAGFRQQQIPIADRTPSYCVLQTHQLQLRGSSSCPVRSQMARQRQFPVDSSTPVSNKVKKTEVKTLMRCVCGHNLNTYIPRQHSLQ